MIGDKSKMIESTYSYEEKDSIIKHDETRFVRGVMKLLFGDQLNTNLITLDFGKNFNI